MMFLWPHETSKHVLYLLLGRKGLGEDRVGMLVFESSDLAHLQGPTLLPSLCPPAQFKPRVLKTLFELFPGPDVLNPANNVTLLDLPTPISAGSVLFPSQQKSANLSAATRTPVSSAAILSSAGGLDGFQDTQDTKEPLRRGGNYLDPNDSWGFSNDEDSKSGKAPRRAASEPGSRSRQFEWDSRNLMPESSDNLSRGSSVAYVRQYPTDDTFSQVLQDFKARLDDLEAQKKLRETQDALHELERAQHSHPRAACVLHSIDKQDLDQVVQGWYKDLDVSQYIKQAEVADAMEKAAASHTDGIIQRMEAVEHEVINNAGIAPQLLTRVQMLEASKAINSIKMGGHVFVDEAAVEAWGCARADPNLHRFCPDFVSFFLLAEPKFETVEPGLGQMAAVVKANFKSIDEATIGLSYSIIYPPQFIRASDKQEAQATDGFTWVAPFMSFDVFEGDYHNGTPMWLKKSLDTVAKAIKSGIDFHFPIATRPLSNSVFKAQYT
eukprot:CCRYP_000021-RA/>CCRYP_000021-RA protein AED:0.75 eAED:0.65 QI:0/0/0/0.33/1/1/3/0/494